jgi:P4 family phage/plasmid primase-like protien
VTAAALSEDAVKRWQAALLDGLDLRSHLIDRLVPLSVIEEFQLGWDGQRYTIPVRDREGALVNVRRYTPGGTPKVVNTPGWGRPARLAFVQQLAERPDAVVVITGGEIDALSGIAEGLLCLCSTSGESAVPKGEQLAVLAGRRIALILDSDGPGRAAEARWVKALGGVAAEVRTVLLPVKDLNDWFVKAGRGGLGIDRLIEQAPVVGGARRNPQYLLSKALEKVGTDESRNEVGFWLAAQMRDERYSAAEAWSLALAPFQQAVETRKLPPYSEAEAQSNIDSAFSQPARAAVGATDKRLPLTELGNAERLVRAHRHELRSVRPTGQWLVYDGKAWQDDDLGRAMQWAKDSARAIGSEAAGLAEDEAKAVHGWARQSESRAHLESTLKLAQTERGVAMLPSEFDADPLLLNVANGTLDLRDGSLHTHSADNHLRRLVPVDWVPGAQAPTFERFLQRVQPDPEMRAFLQRAVGYSLTGSTAEQKLLLALGTGSNGKSTFIELVIDLLGNYATFLPAEALAARSAERIPNDVARLNGSRFVSVMEFASTVALNERLIKQLTGGDTVTARYLHQEFFDFRPQCTIWVSTNHAPVIRGTDDGIWRRFLLVPFAVKIPPEEIDPELRARIRAEELPGLLQWAVRGALEWRRVGLAPPQAVLTATASYRAESDVLGAFLEDRCVAGAALSVTKEELYRTYVAWCENSGLAAASMIGFGHMLTERGDPVVEARRIGKHKVHMWVGVGLRSAHHDAGSPHLRSAEADAVVTPIRAARRAAGGPQGSSDADGHGRTDPGRRGPHEQGDGR